MPRRHRSQETPQQPRRRKHKRGQRSSPAVRKATEWLDQNRAPDEQRRAA